MPSLPGDGTPLGDRRLLVIFAVTLMAVLGVASITPAFPRIARELRISESQIALLITAFTLPGVILTPFLGVLADRLGRKRVLVPSLVLFALAGFACFFARHFPTLIALRLVQGAGAAALGSLNVTLIGDFFSGRSRAAAMGYNASVLSIGTAVYPALGGALAMLGWAFPFLLPIAALPVALWVAVALPEPTAATRLPLRAYLGAVGHNVLRREVLALFGASTITFILLYGSYLTYFPFVMERRFGSTSAVIGLFMAVASLATAATSSQLGRLVRNGVRERTLIVVGFVLYGVAFAVIPHIPSLALLVFPALVFGIAQGVNIPALYTLIAAQAPLEQRGAFMSLNGTVLRLGQTLGPLIMAAVYGLGGLTPVFLGGAALALAAAVGLAAALRPRPA